MYAVLQLSLDQPIGREVLEQAVAATESLAKPDCALLGRELFGIVAGNLAQTEALGMQTVLRALGVETEIVAESALPKLPPPKRAQSFTLARDGLHLVEFASAQEIVLPADAFVFAAAGAVEHLAMRPHEGLEWVTKWVAGGLPRQVQEKVKGNRLQAIHEFRVEFYFAREPYRLQWVLDEQTVLRANGEIFHRRDRERLRALLSVLAESLPADRLNLGITRAACGEDLLYPSVRAFEEEIVWSFYRLARRAVG